MYDVLYIITALLKTLCYSLIGIYLLKEWINLEKKYTSDLPFLMGIGILFLIPGTLIDQMVMLNIIGPSLIYNLRYALDLISIQLIFGAMLSVWIASKIKLRYTITISGSVVSLIVFLLIPTDVILLDIASAIISLPCIISLIITFLFTYYTKRLTNVHGLLIAFAAITVLISNVIRPLLKSIAISPLMPYGLAWVTNLIAITGWIFMYFGLKLKPGYVNK
ncbi:MAG: hypothetical protein ACTSPY_00325 [Candidatus Helarchaeota archaeon]